MTGVDAISNKKQPSEPTNSELRLLFAGTPDFSAQILASMIDAGYRPQAVYCQPDRPIGRGKKIQYGAVKTLALEHGIAVEQPLKLDQAPNEQGLTATQVMASYQPDLLIVVAYGLILPQQILTLPPFGCVNIHASLLPRWRGAAPIQRAIQSGDQQTGITIMQMDRGLDTGNMLLRKDCAIEREDSASDLHDRLVLVANEAIIEFLREFSKKQGSPRYPGELQPTQGATYAHKLQKAEAQIDWNHRAVDIYNQIRAFNPWPVSFTYVGKERLRLWSAQMDSLPAQQVQAGQLVRLDKRGILVSCGDGQGILVTELQADGSRRMPVSEFLNAKSHWFESMPLLGRVSGR